MMKAVILSQYGGPECLTLTEIPIPTPACDELLIEVHACGLNPVDYKLRSGIFHEMMPLSFPFILGGDISGVVKEVGTEAQGGFQVGDEVYFSSPLTQGGGNAEFCVIHSSVVAKKPKSLSHVEAASLPVVGLTAIQSLRDFSGIHTGDKVLIHAGAGGVGSFAIQYAKYCGAEVFTTASTKNEAYVRSLGADHVIDYHHEDFVTVCQQAGGMDIVLESMGGLTYPKSIEATRVGGSVPCIVNPPDSDTKALSERKNIKTEFLLLSGRPADLQEIALLVDSRKIRPTVSKVISLEEIRLAHEQIESGRTQGKWVFQISNMHTE